MHQRFVCVHVVVPHLCGSATPPVISVGVPHPLLSVEGYLCVCVAFLCVVVENLISCAGTYMCMCVVCVKVYGEWCMVCGVW